MPAQNNIGGSSEQLARWLPLAKGVKILAIHETGLVALEKPAGCLSHPNPGTTGQSKRSLLRAPYRPERRCFGPIASPAPFKEVFLMHRLDAGTSGAILICLNEKTAISVREAFESKKVDKTYLACVKGVPPEGLWTDKLDRLQLDGAVRVRLGRGKIARARCEIVCRLPSGLSGSVVRLKLFTGMTHQLRAQCALRHSPILGDPVYGDFKWNEKVRSQYGISRRLFLHASEIHVRFALGGKQYTFTASSAIPEEFGMANRNLPAFRT